MKTCKNCGSSHLVPRGKKYFRNQCHACWNETQRARWAEKNEQCLETQKKNYIKHAEKRRAEASAYKKEHSERYALIEWFRKKGISILDIDPESIQALVEMKQAVNAAKKIIKL
jgi:Fe-S cluster assembly scaffold protein SufB